MYLVYSGSKIFHKEDCDIPALCGMPKHYKNIKSLIVKGYHPCQCARKDYLVALHERNKSIIDRERYQYIFAPKSNVFHRKECTTILGARNFTGSYYYQTCLLSGRRPCKLCNPVDSEQFRQGLTNDPAVLPEETLRIRAEERAIKRHKQAMVDRTALENNIYLPTDKKEDLYTLSTSRYAFFASKGYKTFHLRNCKKIPKLQNLEGFCTFESACRAGYKPCRCCKPSDKHNIMLSLPIYTIERSDESMNDLRIFCRLNDFMFTEDGEYFYVETRVGIWRMNVSKSPYNLEHINLIKNPNNRAIFHQQPRLFLSMMDALYYIKRHDDVLKFAWDETKYVPI